MTGTAVQAWLEAVVEERIAYGRGIREIHRIPLPHIGSYDCERVSVSLADGAQVELFLKDYGRTRQSKDEPSRRKTRELRVYRELLAGADLDTPALFGTMQDEEAGQFLLLLELIDAEVVEQVDSRNGVEAVNWLARMQRCFLDNERSLTEAEFLIRHDVEFYERKAAAAERDAVHVAPHCARDVRTILAQYARCIPGFLEPPRSLVHGGFIPWHIFVDRNVQPARVRVVDWELAGLGSTLYDLSIFVDDGPPALRAELCKSYCDAAQRHDLPVADLDALMTGVEAFRLHRVIDWLSRAAEKGYPAEKIDWLVERGKALIAPARR
jgi:aminoglycoside phosphotransferase (APT) family kinase protein